MSTFGFLGTGNMGAALARAAAKAVPAENIYLTNRTMAKAEALAAELGAKACSAKECAGADFIFLGVKPQQMEALFEEIRPALAGRKDAVLVTMAAGLTMAKIRSMAGENLPVIRIMPNTPVSIGKGIILYTSDGVSEAQLDEFKKAAEAAGMLSPIAEKLIDAGSAVSGCGPAFVDLFIEALADGAVACGIPRKDALAYAAAMTEGAARLVLESGKHPAELKDAVCSPGGTTIEGVKALEDGAFRSTVMSAVIAAYKANEKFK